MADGEFSWCHLWDFNISSMINASVQLFTCLQTSREGWNLSESQLLRCLLRPEVLHPCGTRLLQKVPLSMRKEPVFHVQSSQMIRFDSTGSG